MADVVKILRQEEVEPAIFEIEVELSDGSKEKRRMSVFTLQDLRRTLSLPPLES